MDEDISDLKTVFSLENEPFLDSILAINYVDTKEDFESFFFRLR